MVGINHNILWFEKVTDTIGWVYEGDREKRKDLNDQLDNALDKQYLDDLNDTKDKEQEILQSRIDAISLYIEALKYKNEEADRILRDRLIMEMMGLNSMEDVTDQILQDIDDFNKYSEGSFKYYDGIFNDFLNSYRDNVLELDNIQKQFQEVLSSTMSGILGQNNQNIQMGINNTGNISEAMGMSAEDRAALTAAGKKYTIAQQAYLSTTDESLKASMKQAMEQAHKEAEEIRAKYGYSGGEDGSALIITDKGLYAQYMGDGYKDQMKTEKEFYSFYDNLFGDFGDIEDDRLSGISDFANALKNNYSNVNSNNNAYLNDEETFLNGHEGNGDWQANINDDIIQDWLMYIDDAEVSYDYVIMGFADFLEKYRDQIYEYAQLQEELGDLMQNGGIGDTPSSGMEGDSEYWDEMTEEDQQALKEAGEKYNKYAELYAQTGLQKYKDLMEEAHEEAEAIRNKYGYSGGVDGSGNISTSMKGDYANKDTMSDSDKNALKAAGDKYNQASALYQQTGDQKYKDMMDQAHEEAEAIRNNYGYSGGIDGSDYIKDLNKLIDKENNINKNRVNNLTSATNKLDNIYSNINELMNQNNKNTANNNSIYNDNANYLTSVNNNLIDSWEKFNADTQVQYDMQNMSIEEFANKYQDTIDRIVASIEQLQGALNDIGDLTVGGVGANGTGHGVWEDTSNLPGGAYVDSDTGKVVYPDGHPGAEIDKDNNGSPDSDWLYDNDAPSWVVIGEIMDESGMDYDEARDYYNKHVNKGGSSSSGSSGSGGSSSSNKHNSSSSSSGGIIGDAWSSSSSSNKGSSSSNKGNSSNKGSSSSSSNKGHSSSSSNKGSSSSSGGKPSWVGVSESMKDTGKSYADTIKKYAGGIEEGPVTYTGLAMLHGSTGKPEYVLNNDQAYNLLYNLSSSRLSDFETKNDNNGETYVYNIGEVNVDGTDDPADFWNTVMNAAGNRHNVTKNGTYKNR